MSEQNKLLQEYTDIKTVEYSPTETSNVEEIPPPSYYSLYPNGDVVMGTVSDRISKDDIRREIGWIASGILLGCALIFPPKVGLFVGLSLVTMTLTIF
jgi:hypothetical protein